MNFVKMRYCALFFGAIATTALSIDHANRYAGVRFQPFPVHSTEPWATHLDVAYDSARAHHSYGTHGDPTELFNAHGPFRIDVLRPVPVAPAPDYADQTEQQRVSYAIRDELGLSPDEASLVFSGKYAQEQVAVDIMQHLMSGVFIHVYLPFKEQKLTNIGYRTKLTVDQYASNDGGLTAVEKYEGFLQLIDSQYYLNPGEPPLIPPSDPVSLTKAIEEADLSPLFSNFKHTDIGDPGIYLGWGGEKTFKKSIVDYLNGTLRLGVILPIGRRTEVDQCFSLPFGYEKHWAIAGRGCGEIGMFKVLAVGGSVGASIFFSRSYPKRLKSDPLQNGWLMFDKGVVHVDQGSLWDLSAYVKAQHRPWGLAAWVGAVYFNESPTRFNLRDTVSELSRRESVAVEIRQKNQEEFTKEDLNSDARLKSWHHYVMHFGVSWDAAEWFTRKTGPFLAFTYDYSLAGKYSWRTDVIGGRAGLHCSWKW